MANKMLIDASHPEETRVVVVRGQKVEEFDFESASRRQLRGNIYLAKVTRVEPSLQAAFVEYGGNRHGFLAFSEIHPDYYQIPVADRQALLAEDARAEREEEREDERRRSRPRRARGAPRRSDGGETVAEEVAAEEVEAEDVASEGTEAERASEEQAPDAAPIGAAEVPAELAPAESFDESGAPITELAPAPRFEGEPESVGHGDTPPESGSADSDAPIGEAAEVEARAGAIESGAEVEDHGGNGAEHPDDEAEPIIEQVGGRGDALEEIPERRRPHRRQYKIQEVIKRRQILLVQVVKEERGTKGAALTTYLSLAGRYSVLMPNTGRGGGISRKITSAADRKRLKEIAQDLEVPEGMGIILRTAGASRTRAEIKRDFEYLMRLWESVRELTLTSSAPALVYEEGSLIKRAIRDLYNKDIDEVMVAGDEAYREAKDFMRMLMPSHAKAVKPYKDPQPLFARFGIEQQLDAMFSNHVTLKSGGYLVINPTEALVSIDVNSGPLDPRAQHRGHGAADQPRGRGGDRPAAAPARPRRAHRHRLHRHGGEAQQPLGREEAQRVPEERPRPHPGRPHLALRPPRDVAPAHPHRRARIVVGALPALRRRRARARDALGRAAHPALGRGDPDQERGA